MQGAVYQLVIVAVGAWAVFRGFNRGLARQMPPLLALALAVVVTRVLLPDALPWLMRRWTEPASEPGAMFVYQAVAGALLFFPTLGVARGLFYFVDLLMKVIPVGLLSSICGSLVNLLRYMVILSAAYNLLAALQPEGTLVRTVGLYDGNLASGVMLLSPAVFGIEDYDTLLIEQQLDEARYISTNYTNYSNNPNNLI